MVVVGSKRKNRGYIFKIKKVPRRDFLSFEFIYFVLTYVLYIYIYIYIYIYYIYICFQLVAFVREHI